MLGGTRTGKKGRCCSLIQTLTIQLLESLMSMLRVLTKIERVTALLLSLEQFAKGSIHGERLHLFNDRKLTIRGEMEGTIFVL